jgi:hypothetical protein
MTSFEAVFMAEYREGYATSWYDMRNDGYSNSSTPSKYYFTLNESTPMVIRVVNYPWKMYPYSCKMKPAILRVVLKT